MSGSGAEQGRITVTLNGEARSLAADTSVRQLLADLPGASGRVAVELNREIVPRSRHETTLLRPGDTIEIVSFVGGG